MTKILSGLIVVLAMFLSSTVDAQRSASNPDAYTSETRNSQEAVSSDEFTSGWRLCNQSNFDEIYVAYSYYEDGDWVTKGWRLINSGECEVFQTKITNNTAYYYAISGDENGEWRGDVELCAHPTEKFEYFGDVQNCAGGYEWFPFYAVDLSEQTVVTRNLTSN